MKKFALAFGLLVLGGATALFALRSSDEQTTVEATDSEYCVCTPDCQPGDEWCSCPDQCSD